MTRTMYDSTNADGIPANSLMNAGYVGGNWPSYAAIVKRFPNAVNVRIAVNASEDADVLDIERGDALPEQAGAWTVHQHSLGVARPTSYCNRSNLPAVDEALHAANVPTSVGCVWLATLDGTVETGATAHGYPIVACQIADHGGYDESTVFDDNWHPFPRVVVPVVTQPDHVGNKLRYSFQVTTDPNGNGYDNEFEARNLPFAQWNGSAPCVEGSDPAPKTGGGDGVYWGGTGHCQDRDGKCLVSVTGCAPNANVLVYITLEQ